MTDPKTRLAEIRAAVEQSLSDGAGGDRFPARDLVVLLERIAHLEGLVKEAADRAGLDNCDAYGCPWCWQYDGDPHTNNCPAFTPEGEIK